MGEISILDLQNLRHLIGGYATTYSKMTDYACLLYTSDAADE